MLPTMQPLDPSRTKRARAAKAFEVLRIGPVRLYFSHFELIGFQVDGSPPVVRVAAKAAGVDVGGHVEQHRLRLEPDRSKWYAEFDFERAWEAAFADLFR